MVKAIIPVYIVCFSLYILFSRRPDYQDGEITTGIIHYIKDSAQQNIAKAIFSVNKSQYIVVANYPFRRLKEGEVVNIIYETADPSKAVIYSLWGYWIKLDELIASILIPFIFIYAAKAITSGPTPEATIEEIEMGNRPKRKKYD